MKISHSSSPLNSYAAPSGKHKQAAVPQVEFKSEDIINTSKAAAAASSRAVSQIADKIEYLEKQQERIQAEADDLYHGFSDTPTVISSMAGARSFAIRVNLMVLKYRRCAVMAQANAAPQRVLSLVGR
jgi:hypothetical protein